MMKRYGLVLGFFYIFLLAYPVFSQPFIDEQLIRVKYNLDDLANEAFHARMTSRGLFFGFGGAIILVSLLPITNGDYLEQPIDAMPIIEGLVVGAVLVYFGVQTFPLSPAENYYGDYLLLPEETDEEKLEKLRRGESMLHELSDNGSRARILSGFIFLIATAVQATIFISGTATGSLDFSQETPYVLIAYFSACGITSLFCFCIPSWAESKWNSYQDWKKDGMTAPYSRAHIIPTLSGVKLRIAL